MAFALPTARASRCVPPMPGMIAELDLRLSELGVVGGDDEIAVLGKLAAAAQRKTGDRGDDRLARVGHAVPGRPKIAEENIGKILVGHFLDVGARRKRVVRAGDDHAADVAVGLERIDGLAKLAHQRAVERIERLRPIEPDEPDPAAPLDDDVLGAHGCFLHVSLIPHCRPSFPPPERGRSKDITSGRRAIERRAAVLHDALDGAFFPPPRSGGGGPRDSAVEGASAATHILNRKFYRRVSTPPPPPSAVPLPRCRGGGQILPFSRRMRARVLPSHAHESHSAKKEKKEWSAERRQGRGPRHAGECYHSLALRAWRAPQTIRLREPPASGARRLPALHRGSRSRLSTAARGNRSRSASRCRRLASFR